MNLADFESKTDLARGKFWQRVIGGFHFYIAINNDYNDYDAYIVHEVTAENSKLLFFEPYKTIDLCLQAFNEYIKKNNIKVE